MRKAKTLVCNSLNPVLNKIMFFLNHVSRVPVFTYLRFGQLPAPLIAPWFFSSTTSPHTGDFWRPCLSSWKFAYRPFHAQERSSVWCAVWCAVWCQHCGSRSPARCLSRDQPSQWGPSWGQASCSFCLCLKSLWLGSSQCEMVLWATACVHPLSEEEITLWELGRSPCLVHQWVASVFYIWEAAALPDFHILTFFSCLVLGYLLSRGHSSCRGCI